MRPSDAKSETFFETPPAQCRPYRRMALRCLVGTDWDREELVQRDLLGGGLGMEGGAAKQSCHEVTHHPTWVCDNFNLDYSTILIPVREQELRVSLK